ncbi:DUF6624 domain-containing protein [Pedobacter cryoconitis]|uniref:DUF6624 domain-containing protein n=1 Tax=Pedobacter cryoconitis TaxID=188932 RepID=UPI00161A5E1E|nr:DUF6624 domain-containing protein [Pedobacter cryoconitis]MBB5646090.1 hypothetical protein [Pedobacter cryoconitis]
MRIFLSLFLCLFTFTNMGFSQNNFYNLYTKAYQYYNDKKYKDAGTFFSKAYLDNYKTKKIESIAGAGYNAACSWSLAKQPDSAFYILNKAVNDERFLTFYTQLPKDSDFDNLRNDPRWKKITSIYLKTKETFEKGQNKEITDLLANVRKTDQEERLKALDYEKKYGGQSTEAKNKWAEVEKLDVINFKTVSHIIDSLGWPGPKLIGYEGAQTLFLVIQHSSLENQLKYLPILKQAVKKGDAMPGSLAYLEDRISIKQKLPQKYGTQLVRDGSTGKILYPARLLDPRNIDKLREAAGLEPIENYLRNNGADWDLEEYIKKHP